MHLHFLRARTVASYNDLTWHIFASFLCFVFIFISPYGSIKFHLLGKPCKQVFLSNVHFIKTKSLEGKILAFTHTSRFFTLLPYFSRQKSSLHTLLLFGCAQFSAPRSWVDKQLLSFRSHWLLRQYFQWRFLAQATFFLQKILYQSVL